MQTSPCSGRHLDYNVIINMKRKIEIFTAGCQVCAPVVELVESMACSNCEIEIHDLSKQSDPDFYTEKLQTYKITSLPTVVINGQKLEVSDEGVTKELLSKAGVGSC